MPRSELTLRRFLGEVDGPRRPKRKAGNFKRVKVVAMVAPEPQRMVVSLAGERIPLPFELKPEN